MRQEPDPALLYPEVAEHGSLAVAIQTLAAAQAIPLAVTATASDLLRHATVPSILPHREPLFVAAWHHERRWWVSGSANNGMLISGVTNDLAQVPAVAHGWAEGQPLNEIEQSANFELLTGRFDVPDGNLDDVITSEWQYMLKDAENSDSPGFQALIEAAYTEPTLRRRYPCTSHGALGLFAAPYPFAESFLSVHTAPDGYTLHKWWWGPAVLKVSTASEAIGAFVDRLRKGLDDRHTVEPDQVDS
ncbi:MAG TPA: hypothetical protein DGG94_04100 [Micromonosporaceae bacterium]|nr:hypothetical protein [Micromonosporaceae bacterium]HCU48981.1 hypothetical protein [Micromonosporaceae bacterium]